MIFLIASGKIIMDKKTITKEISDLELLESLTNAYAEISSTRMKRTRGSVLLNRTFLEEIASIFKEVQESYAREVLVLARKKGFKKGQKITFLAHNGKVVAVFMSANTSFYGDLTKKVFDAFLKEVEEKNVEATIVGNLGLGMFRDHALGRPYSYFELPDYGVDRNQMAELVRHLVEYEEIHIYYGKFKSVINQTPDMVVISSQTELNTNKNTKAVKYLFEPSLEEILMFFETEMFSSIFEQTVNESQLAKFASRMIAMDQAAQKVKETLGNVKIENLRLIHNTYNKKQLEYLSSIERTFI